MDIPVGEDFIDVDADRDDLELILSSNGIRKLRSILTQIAESNAVKVRALIASQKVEDAKLQEGFTEGIEAVLILLESGFKEAIDNSKEIAKH